MKKIIFISATVIATFGAAKAFAQEEPPHVPVMQTCSEFGYAINDAGRCFRGIDSQVSMDGIPPFCSRDLAIERALEKCFTKSANPDSCEYVEYCKK